MFPSGRKEEKQTRSLTVDTAKSGPIHQNAVSNETTTTLAETVLYGLKVLFGQTGKAEECFVEQMLHPCMMLVSTMTIHRTDHRSAGCLRQVADLSEVKVLLNCDFDYQFILGFHHETQQCQHCSPQPGLGCHHCPRSPLAKARWFKAKATTTGLGKADSWY